MRVFKHTPYVDCSTDLQSSIAAAIFDFDGTLFNSEDHGSQCMFAAITKQNPSISLSYAEQQSLAQQCLGRSLTYILDLLATKLKIDRQQLDDDYRDLWHKNVNNHMAIADSIALVRQLHKNCIPLSICTGSELDQVKLLLQTENIEPLFDHIVSADDYQSGEGKPNPVPYILSINRYKSPPCQMIAFEDTVVGVKSAQAAGIEKIIALCHRTGFEEQLYHAGATLVVNSLQDMRVFKLCGISPPEPNEQHDNAESMRARL